MRGGCDQLFTSDVVATNNDPQKFNLFGLIVARILHFYC
ncbi:hypothetical protein UYSO10_2164 [Kosakonia radicincitans]|nr:hypothetical protein UYSO10_2164 [Kosakonia radicincitans]